MQRVSVKNISKKFRIGFKKKQSVLWYFLSIFSGREPKKDIWALNNISFELKEGEILGILGKNGSGKSTLLRIVAGIYQPDMGQVLTHGKIISLINLGAALQDRLSMKDNIFLCCSLFGLGRQEIKDKLNSIAEFSGLAEYMETKIYQFSEGMKQRLAFSLAIFSRPEILLLDEVFEIGDENFKNKSAKKIQEAVSQGLSVVLVTHDLSAVKKYCSKVMWMEKGEIVEQGNSQEIVESYINS